MPTTPRDLDLASAFTIAMVWTLGIEAVFDARFERGSGELVERIKAGMPAALRELLEGIGSSTVDHADDRAEYRAVITLPSRSWR
jgi:hypothetical protein